MNEKRLDIQGIRGVAIILVLLCHFFPNQFLIGYIGVDIYIEKPYMSWERPRIYFLLVATCLCTAVLVYIPPSSPYPFPNAEFNYTGVNVSDASWNHTLMQLLTYHESVRWPANERNLVIPGCKYNKKFAASATEPFGFCEHEPGSGNLTTLVIGNSFACNQADMVHSAFKRIYSNFYVLCLMICEVLSKTDDALCKTRVNYIEIVEELKPNLVFILDRKVVTKEVNDTKAFDNDYVFMQHLYNLASIEHVADKVFILDALPSCRLSCCTMALDFMMKGNKPLRDIGSWLILNDDKPARMRHKELRKRCKKCELIDYLPALLDDDGVYRGYDPDTNLMYVDEVNHLNIFAKQRLQPLFDSLAERVEAAVAAVSFYNFTSTDSKEAFFSVWCRLWQFAFGIIAFLFTHKGQCAEKEEQEEAIILDTMVYSDNSYRENFGALLFLVLANPMIIPYAYEHLQRVHATAFTMLLLVIGHREKILFLCHPLLVYIGNISYALYLVHWPIYKFIKYWWPGVLGAPIGFLLSFFVADLVCKYIEKPYMKWERPRIYFLLAITSLCTAVLVYIPPTSPYPFPNAEFNYTGVNVSDASWNHTLMQSLTYHESVRWYANYRNTLMPGCKYSKRYTPSAVEPFGFCEHEPGSGNLTTLVVGNSFACNQADMVHSAFKRLYSKFYVLCLMVCEVLSITDDVLCKTRVNYVEIIEELKPNLVFILDRKVVAKEVNDTKALDNDYVFMQHLYNLISIEQVADKKFPILQSWLILNDDKPARMRHQELRKRCKKCELIDYLPALVDDDGVYRGYDRETNLMYIDEVNHLNIFAKQRVQPLFDRLAKRVEADLIGTEEV
ncbi:hypothetical protein Q1695_004640 [Nippostrongylus brasiliensis]|nr:hypothetical protein Q1695_004640 [Nippostrongylus brasiliensis]